MRKKKNSKKYSKKNSITRNSITRNSITRNSITRNSITRNRITRNKTIKKIPKIGGMEQTMSDTISIKVTILDNTKKKGSIIASYNNVVVNINDDIIESIYSIDDNTHLNKNDKISVQFQENYIFPTDTYQQKKLISGDTIIVNINKKIDPTPTMTHNHTISHQSPLINFFC